MTLLGCANISSPTGGKRDKTPPKLMGVSPADSLKNTRVKRIELNFDEYITVGDVQKEVEIMPILAIAPAVTSVNKHVVVKIVDSLLEPNTTYRISFGKSIKDVHEGNAFDNYTYTFSTGNYFDSLALKGSVTNAATGLPDTANVLVVLYDAAENDTAVLKKKPKYLTRAKSNGTFVFGGLPARQFRIYAIKDANTNGMYDGDGDMIAFSDSTVMPVSDSMTAAIGMRLFAEVPDTAAVARKAKDNASTGKGLRRKERAAAVDTNFTYTTNLDTASLGKRSYDINKPIKLTFNKIPVIARDKISLTYDSAGSKVSPDFSVKTDTAHPFDVLIDTRWAENRVYRLRLDTGFVSDTTGRILPGARFAFRTNNNDDYGKISVHVPGKYYGKEMDYVLMVKGDDDTVYQKRITDTVINLNRLRPATYTFRIIADKNKNGKWDTGDLLGRKQPEEVIPSKANVKLKTGWEHTIDFEEQPKPDLRKGGIKGSAGGRK